MLTWLDLRRGSARAALERAHRLVRNDPDNTEGPPILGELAVVVGDSGARQLIEPLARQDPKAAGQMFPESLRSLYALTLHRQGDARQRGRGRARPDGAGGHQRHRGAHR